MKLHRCVGLAVLVALVAAPIVARAEDDAGTDAAADAEAGVDNTSSSSTSSTSSGSPPITVDPGGKVPGSGQTEEVPDDGGCSTSPARIAPTGVLALALAALWFVRRKKR